MMLATDTALMFQVVNAAVAAFGKDGGKSARADLTKTIKRLSADGQS